MSDQLFNDAVCHALVHQELSNLRKEIATLQKEVEEKTKLSIDFHYTPANEDGALAYVPLANVPRIISVCEIGIHRLNTIRYPIGEYVIERSEHSPFIVIAGLELIRIMTGKALNGSDRILIYSMANNYALTLSVDEFEVYKKSLLDYMRDLAKENIREADQIEAMIPVFEEFFNC